MRYGLIAGNGRFPLLALESAQKLGHDVTVIAIQEEAPREVEAMAPRCHWISLGQIQILEDEGIHLRDSTSLLKPLLANEGVMTERKPGKDEVRDVDYGRRVANALAGFDVGQSVAICERACVAVEAMEGTDAMLRRAASLVNGRPMALVKVARRREHLLFDVPVVGLDTIPVMRETGTTVLAVEAGRTLMLDRDRLLEAANAGDIAIVGQGANVA